MAVRITQYHKDEGVGSPYIGDQARPGVESNYTWKRPDRLQHSNKTALVKFFAQPRNAQQGKDMNDVWWNGEEIGIELKLVSCLFSICRCLPRLTVLNPSDLRVSVR